MKGRQLIGARPSEEGSTCCRNGGPQSVDESRPPFRCSEMAFMPRLHAQVCKRNPAFTPANSRSLANIAGLFHAPVSPVRHFAASKWRSCRVCMRRHANETRHSPPPIQEASQILEDFFHGGRKFGRSSCRRLPDIVARKIDRSSGSLRQPDLRLVDVTSSNRKFPHFIGNEYARRVRTAHAARS